MIIINLQSMIFAKQVEWKRHITLKEVAESTGISRMTLHRMVKILPITLAPSTSASSAIILIATSAP